MALMDLFCANNHQTNATQKTCNCFSMQALRYGIIYSKSNRNKSNTLTYIFHNIHLLFLHKLQNLFLKHKSQVFQYVGKLSFGWHISIGCGFICIDQEKQMLFLKMVHSLHSVWIAFSWSKQCRFWTIYHFNKFQYE